MRGRKAASGAGALGTRAGPCFAIRARQAAEEPQRHFEVRDMSKTDPNDAAANAVKRDNIAKDSQQPQLVDLLRFATKESGRGSWEIGREYLRLFRSKTKLHVQEYVQYGVYRTDLYTREQQAEFVSNQLCWPITFEVCDMTWQAATEDKWLCTRILEMGGYPMPKSLAVIDTSARNWPDTHVISSPETLRDFLKSAEMPVFAKENRGIASFGAFLVTAADDEALTLSDGTAISYDSFFADHIGDVAYLLQPVAQNHPFLARYTPNLCTVRVCILVDGPQVHIPFCVLKMPTSDNVADSFWRKGNVACKVDTETGKIATIRTKDPFKTTDHEVHPESGLPLMGETLPHWQELMDLAREVAQIFPAVKYQSMDIAITPDGPLIIEVNTSGGFDLPQLATGEGFMKPEVRDFFRRHGSKLV